MTDNPGGFNLGTAHGSVEFNTNIASAMQSAEREFRNGIQRMGSQVQTWGQSVSRLGTTMTTHVTLPLVAAGGASIKAAADFDSSMTNISARTGLVGKDLEAVRSLALDLGRDTKFSAQESADAFLQLLAAGHGYEDAMKILPAVLDAAAASNADLEQTADLVTNTMSAFNLEAGEAGRVVDLMAKAAASSPATLTDMGQALQKSGGFAASMGISIDDVNSVLALFAQRGVKGEEAGTQFRSMMVAMTSEAGPTKDAWNELGVSMYDTEGVMRPLNDIFTDVNESLKDRSAEDQNRLIQALAGSYGLVGFTALLGDNAIADMSETISGQASAADVAAQQMGAFSGKVTSLKGSIETLMIQAFTPFMDKVLTPLVGTLTDIINGVSDWAAENPALTEVIVSFGAALAAIGPTLFIVGKLIAGLGFVISFIASPIGLVVAAVAGLALAWKTDFMGIREFTMNEVLPRLREFVDFLIGIWDAISPTLGNIWMWFTEEGLPGITSYITETIIPGIQTFVDFLVGIWDAISPTLGLIWMWFTEEGLPGIKDFIEFTFMPVITNFANFIEGIWDLVSVGLGLLYDWFVTNGLPVINGAIDNTMIVIRGLRNMLMTLWGVVSPPLMLLKGVFASVFNWIKDNIIQPVVDKINGIKEALNDITGGAAALGQAGNDAQAIAGRVASGQNSVGDVVGATVWSIGSEIGLWDSGGMAPAGKPALIGTGAQPELFIPSTSGLMIPNADELMGGTRLNITIGSINANSVAEGREAAMGFRAELQQWLDAEG